VSEMKTLKQKISEISVYSFICMAVLMFTCFMLYSIKKSKVTEENIRNDLTLNLKNQTAQFLPLFLLPEQRQGMELMLEKIKSDENLESIKILSTPEEVPEDFKNCRLNQRTFVTCSSSDFSETAILAPLKEGDEVFGYIFKSKRNSSAAGLVSLMQFAGLTMIILAIAFTLIYLRLRTLISKTIPQSMEDLLTWIESEIQGNESPKIQLPFKELEDLKFKMSEVIEKANKSRDQAIIGQVTSGIMHDIKTPLHSIVTATHLVNEHEIGSEKRNRRLENLFNMCAGNIPHIGEIIETTLDGNRNIQITKSKANLKETIDHALEITKEFSRLRNVSVEIDVPSEIIAEFDSHQFVRVLNNLLKNGIEAASESAAETIPRVKISSLISNKSVHLIVEDSGAGFKTSPDKAFRAFRTTKTRGTGLGLLISKKIVEAHSGRIEASNASVFGGAKMEVTLPIQGTV
jgi:signal transduction histidine kinase